MTPRRLAALQEEILDAVKRAHPGTRDEAIAGAAGVDRTQISKWRSGAREMRVSDLVGTLGPFGAVAVLGPVANLASADVVERVSVDVADPRTAAIDIAASAVDLGRTVHLALADGRIDAQEAEIIAASVEALVVELRRLAAGARADS